MKSLPFLLSMGATSLCLLLCVWLSILGGGNRGVQKEMQALQQEVQTQQQTLETRQQELQTQQEQINAGQTISQQVGPALLRDLATLSVKNDKIKRLLTRHGYNVEVKDDPTKPAAAPATPGTPTPQ